TTFPVASSHLEATGKPPEKPLAAQSRWATPSFWVRENVLWQYRSRNLFARLKAVLMASSVASLDFQTADVSSVRWACRRHHMKVRIVATWGWAFFRSSSVHGGGGEAGGGGKGGGTVSSAAGGGDSTGAGTTPAVGGAAGKRTDHGTAVVVSD